MSFRRRRSAAEASTTMLLLPDGSVRIFTESVSLSQACRESRTELAGISDEQLVVSQIPADPSQTTEKSRMSRGKTRHNRSASGALDSCHVSTSPSAEENVRSTIHHKRSSSSLAALNLVLSPSKGSSGDDRTPLSKPHHRRSASGSPGVAHQPHSPGQHAARDGQSHAANQASVPGAASGSLWGSPSREAGSKGVPNRNWAHRRSASGMQDPSQLSKSPLGTETSTGQHVRGRHRRSASESLDIGTLLDQPPTHHRTTAPPRAQGPGYLCLDAPGAPLPNRAQSRMSATKQRPRAHHTRSSSESGGDMGSGFPEKARVLMDRFLGSVPHSRSLLPRTQSSTGAAPHKSAGARQGLGCSSPGLEEDVLALGNTYVMSALCLEQGSMRRGLGGTPQRKCHRASPAAGVPRPPRPHRCHSSLVSQSDTILCDLALFADEGMEPSSCAAVPETHSGEVGCTSDEPSSLAAGEGRPHHSCSGIPPHVVSAATSCDALPAWQSSLPTAGLQDLAGPAMCQLLQQSPAALRLSHVGQGCAVPAGRAGSASTQTRMLELLREARSSEAGAWAEPTGNRPLPDWQQNLLNGGHVHSHRPGFPKAHTVDGGHALQQLLTSAHPGTPFRAAFISEGCHSGAHRGQTLIIDADADAEDSPPQFPHQPAFPPSLSLPFPAVGPTPIHRPLHFPRHLSTDESLGSTPAPTSRSSSPARPPHPRPRVPRPMPSRSGLRVGSFGRGEEGGGGGGEGGVEGCGASFRSASFSSGECGRGAESTTRTFSSGDSEQRDTLLSLPLPPSSSDSQGVNLAWEHGHVENPREGESSQSRGDAAPEATGKLPERPSFMLRVLEHQRRIVSWSHSQDSTSLAPPENPGPLTWQPHKSGAHQIPAEVAAFGSKRMQRSASESAAEAEADAWQAAGRELPSRADAQGQWWGQLEGELAPGWQGQVQKSQSKGERDATGGSSSSSSSGSGQVQGPGIVEADDLQQASAKSQRDSAPLGARHLTVPPGTASEAGHSTGSSSSAGSGATSSQDSVSGKEGTEASPAEPVKLPPPQAWKRNNSVTADAIHGFYNLGQNPKPISRAGSGASSFHSSPQTKDPPCQLAPQQASDLPVVHQTSSLGMPSATQQHQVQLSSAVHAPLTQGSTPLGKPTPQQGERGEHCVAAVDQEASSSLPERPATSAGVQVCGSRASGAESERPSEGERAGRGGPHQGGNSERERTTAEGEGGKSIPWLRFLSHKMGKGKGKGPASRAKGSLGTVEVVPPAGSVPRASTGESKLSINRKSKGLDGGRGDGPRAEKGGQRLTRLASMTAVMAVEEPSDAEMAQSEELLQGEGGQGQLAFDGAAKSVGTFPDLEAECGASLARSVTERGQQGAGGKEGRRRRSLEYHREKGQGTNLESRTKFLFDLVSPRRLKPHRRSLERQPGTAVSEREQGVTETPGGSSLLGEASSVLSLISPGKLGRPARSRENGKPGGGNSSLAAKGGSVFAGEQRQQGSRRRSLDSAKTTRLDGEEVDDAVGAGRNTADECASVSPQEDKGNKGDWASVGVSSCATDQQAPEMHCWKDGETTGAGLMAARPVAQSLRPSTLPALGWL